MNSLLAVATLWWREQVRFFRQRSRVFGAFVQPLMFWALFGRPNDRMPGSACYRIRWPPRLASTSSKCLRTSFSMIFLPML